MREPKTISVERADPRHPPITALVRELDHYMEGLYPAESNHLLDIEALAAPDIRFFAVRLDADYSGCGAIRVHGSDYAEIKRIFVAPSARGYGLGRHILVRLEEEARQLGLPLMRLETGIYQPEALSLFAAMGFDRCGPFGDYPADDPLSVFMEKQL